MGEKSQQSWWLAPKPFDWVSSALYLGILAISYFKLFTRCSCIAASEAIGVTVAITLAIVILLSIDRLEYYWFKEETPKRAAITLLVLRILLIEGITQLERFYFVPLNYAIMLYLIPPYLATLYFGARAGYWIALLAGVIYLIKTTLYSAHWYRDLPNLWTSTIFCFGLVFLLAMARVVSQEKASRQRAEQLLGELASSHQQLSLYTEQIAELAAFKERNRIARDIHDGLGHALMAISVQLEKALVYHERNPQEALQAVGAARQVTREALQEVRSSVRTLRLTQDDYSCASSIALLIQHLRISQISVDYYTEGDETNFSREIRNTLYRVAQEGFTNIQKHARASKVEVTLLFAEQEARLRIHDNGGGFEPKLIREQTTEGRGGYGLQGMRERIAQVKGVFHLESKFGRGTTLLVSIPAQARTHSRENVAKDGYDEQA
ncbi:sensor histidine kinase [Ktedonosporobacter rubrisoli]|uniref:histidine kinase n=1 Tax=Ktedonosporobacter rubrisoli TaxID=2509675 RepID=A0A4V0YZJ9_KTERU|nr:sensor histidine kinase [Ktedonosporobacter rubrisoli]QBD79981.1 sensor histidine kinase [Ktedonosporobacter rubrisoli]